MRSTVQPLRRNSAMYRYYDDLILWLKFENNFDDSSYYYQQITGHNELIIPSSTKRITDPTFNKNDYYLDGYSAEFNVRDPNAVYKMAPSEESILISGSGVYTTDSDFDSAAEFNLEADFCIEFAAKFSGIPQHETTLFDFGNLKLTNTSGMFEMEGPDGDVIQYYDPIFAGETSFEDGSWAATMTNTWTHYAVQRRNNELEFWIGPKDEQGKRDNPFLIVAEDTQSAGTITGIKEAPYNNCRAIGSTITGSNFFTGLMDEFKVWKKAIYGPEPVISAPRPQPMGIFVINDTQHAGYHTRAGISRIINNLRNSTAFQRASQQGTATAAGVSPSEHSTPPYSWPMLWCYVQTVYDPRYSSHVPVPYEVEWYKDVSNNSSSPQLNYLGSSKNTQFGWKSFTNSNKYVFNTFGIGDMVIKNFTALDEGWYYARIKYGNPARPINIYQSPQIARQKLVLQKYIPPITCFTENQPILLHNGEEKKISEIIPGDRVYGFKDGKVCKNVVDNTGEVNVVDFYYELTVNDKIIEVSEGHPIYVGNEKYKNVEELESGDTVYIFDNEKLKKSIVQFKRRVDKRVKVYNISVDESNTYFANGLAVHNKSFPPVPRLEVTCPNHQVNLGSTAVMRAEFAPSNAPVPGPITFTWINKGNGIQAPLGPRGSSLTFTNVRSSLAGQVCPMAVDGNGRVYTGSCCTISLKLPALQCPRIKNVSPSKSNKDIKVVRPFTNISWPGQICHFSTRYEVVPDQQNIDVTFMVDAEDTNPSELNTGGLKYEWLYPGSSTWTTVSPVNQYNASLNQNQTLTYQCRVSHVNYPAGTQRQDPEGNTQYGVYTIMEFQISFPACVTPHLSWCQRQPFIHSPAASRMHGLPITVNHYSASAVNYGWCGVGWPGWPEKKVTVYNCTEDFEVCLKFLGNDTGDWCCQYRKNTGLGFANNRTLGDGIVIEGTYKSAKILPAINYCYSGDAGFDRIVITKDLYKDNDGDQVKVTVKSPCGDLTYIITYAVHTEGIASLAVTPNDSRYFKEALVTCSDWVGPGSPVGAICTVEYDVLFYRQKTKVYNWNNNLTSETQTILPRRNHITLSPRPIRDKGCYNVQVEKDGAVMVPWTGRGFAYSADPGFYMAMYFGMHYGGGGYIIFNNTDDQSYWPNDNHQLTIKVRNNLTSSNPATGVGNDYRFNIKYVDLPVIISRTRRGPFWCDGGWVINRSGQWQRGRCYWNAWWYRGTVDVSTGSRGWVRYNPPLYSVRMSLRATTRYHIRSIRGGRLIS